jgi:transcriptional regulator with XRE-family HTH domain
MGQARRRRPARLPQKLRQIRERLGLSQDGMVDCLGLRGPLTRERISEYENGEREAPLPTLLRYARAAGVWMDVLVDDNLDLPKKLPCIPKHEGIAHKISTRVHRKY